MKCTDTENTYCHTQFSIVRRTKDHDIDVTEGYLCILLEYLGDIFFYLFRSAKITRATSPYCKHLYELMCTIQDFHPKTHFPCMPPVGSYPHGENTSCFSLFFFIKDRTMADYREIQVPISDQFPNISQSLFFVPSARHPVRE